MNFSTYVIILEFRVLNLSGCMRSVSLKCGLFSRCCNIYLSIGTDSHQDAVGSAQLPWGWWCY